MQHSDPHGILTAISALTLVLTVCVASCLFACHVQRVSRLQARIDDMVGDVDGFYYVHHGVLRLRLLLPLPRMRYCPGRRRYQRLPFPPEWYERGQGRGCESESQSQGASDDESESISEENWYTGHTTCACIAYARHATDADTAAVPEQEHWHLGFDGPHAPRDGEHELASTMQNPDSGGRGPQMSAKLHGSVSLVEQSSVQPHSYSAFSRHQHDDDALFQRLCADEQHHQNAKQQPPNNHYRRQRAATPHGISVTNTTAVRSEPRPRCKPGVSISPGTPSSAAAAAAVVVVEEEERTARALATPPQWPHPSLPSLHETLAAEDAEHQHPAAREDPAMWPLSNGYRYPDGRARKGTVDPLLVEDAGGKGAWMSLGNPGVRGWGGELDGEEDGDGDADGALRGGGADDEDAAAYSDFQGPWDQAVLKGRSRRCV